MAKQPLRTVSDGAPLTDSVTVGRTRSPNYPVYKIDSALKKGETLYAAFKLFPVPIKAAVEKLGFTAGSSTAAQAIATLKAYGFIDVQGSGENRKITVTEATAKILANHPTRAELLKKAALLPKIHDELYKRFVGAEGLAPDETIRHYLRFDREESKFNEQSIDPLIRQFKGTLAFAGLDSSDTLPDADVGNGVKVGDFIQWDSQGVARFAQPVRVLRISDDGTHAFVAETTTGLPMDQIYRVDPPNGKVVDPVVPASITTKNNQVDPPPPPPAPQGSRQDTCSLDEGPAVLIYPANLSEHSLEDFKYWVEGAVRKIERSIKRSTKGADAEQANA